MNNSILSLSIIFLLTGLINLNAQKEISFGGQYSAIHRSEKKVSYEVPGALKSRYNEFYMANIESPGLIVSVIDSGRWERIYSIVSLEFDYFTVVKAYDIAQTGQRTYDGYDVGSMYTHLEYGMRYRLLKESSFIVQPYVGFSLEPIIEHVTVMPYASNEFEWKETNVSIATSIVLQGKLQLNKHIRINLSGHLWLGEIYYESGYVDSPILTKEQKERTEIGIDIMPKKLRGTLGVVYTLRK